jgi:GT2 family glycosyltransferase
MSEPNVAVLLLNWNGWQDTLQCLESVFRMRYDNLTVVVCDNASTDGSVDRILAWAEGAVPAPAASQAEFQSVTHPAAAKPITVSRLNRAEAESGVSHAASRMVLIDNGANLGFSGGNNVGLRYLLGRRDVDYVWILNNDVVVDADCLRSLVQVAQETPRCGGVGAMMLEYHHPGVIQAVGGGYFSPRHLYPVLKTDLDGDSVEFLSGACLLVPISALREIGLIDETFFIYCEDVDFSLRLTRAGYALRYARAARLWHKGGSTVGHRSTRHDYYTVRNTLALVRRYYPMQMPRAYFETFYRCVLPKVFRRQKERLAAACRGIADYRRGDVGKAAI